MSSNSTAVVGEQPVAEGLNSATATLIEGLEQTYDSTEQELRKCEALLKSSSMLRSAQAAVLFTSSLVHGVHQEEDMAPRHSEAQAEQSTTSGPVARGSKDSSCSDRIPAPPESGHASRTFARIGSTGDRSSVSNATNQSRSVGRTSQHLRASIKVRHT